MAKFKLLGITGAMLQSFLDKFINEDKTTTGEANKLLKLSDLANTVKHIFKIRKTATDALDVANDAGTSVFKVDTENERGISTREATLLTETYSFITPAISNNATLRISCDLIPSSTSTVKFFEIELNFLSRQSGSSPQLLISKKFIGWFYLGDAVREDNSAVLVSSIDPLLSNVKFELNSEASDNDTLIIDIFNDDTGRNVAAGFCSVRGTGIKNVKSLGIV